MLNDFNITDIEKLVSCEVRKLGVSEHVWNNRPKAVDDSISDFVVVRVSGGICDKAAFGTCGVVVQLFVRDVLEMKNTKRLEVMQDKMMKIPLTIGKLIVDGLPRTIGDTADDFGFHVRYINFRVIIKAN